MFLKKIEIEGFKSYAQRQVIDFFDEEFNAVSGRNGTGKSNILDSILFVLGITDLKQVRATNNTDLVFKRGQAGINKALVTLTFDNRPRNGKRCSPRNYEEHDEIVIRREIVLTNGSSKSASTYYINGSKTTTKAISDLFSSVGMNVNNPHFLIMQGCVGKVSNGRPEEILGMVEEAAGTKLYDRQRNIENRRIERMDQKVSRIKDIMDTEILPAVGRFKEDRQQAMRHQKLKKKISAEKRKLSAYVFFDALRKVKEFGVMVNERTTTLAAMDDDLKKKEESIAKMETEKDEMLKKKGNEKGNGKAVLDNELEAARNALHLAESTHEDAKQKEEEVAGKMRKASEEKKAEEGELAEKKRELEEKTAEIGDEEKAGNELDDAVKKAKARVDALNQGMTTDDQGQVVTLEARMTDTRTELTQLKDAVETAEATLADLKKKRPQKEADVEKYKKENESNEEWRKKKEEELKRLEDALKQLSFDARIYAEKEKEFKDRIHTVNRLERSIRDGEQRLILPFEIVYRMPYPSFDRTEVLGSILRYFRIKDDKDATALETIVSAYLRHVLVKNAAASVALLKNNCFQTRVTLTNLDKVATVEVGPNAQWEQRILAAKQAGQGDDVESAFKCISFDNQFRLVMFQLFKGYIICDTPAAAKNIAYNPPKMNTVTRDGIYKFDPKGIISGGSKDTRWIKPDLIAIRKWHEECDALAAKRKEVEDCQVRFRLLTQQRDHFDAENAKVETLRRELEAHVEKMKSSLAERSKNDLEDIDRGIKENHEFIAKSQEKLQELQHKIIEFEKKKNDKTSQEKDKAEANENLKKLQQKQKNIKDTFGKAKKTLEGLRTEISNLENSITASATKMSDLTVEATEAQAETAKAETEFKKAKDLLTATQKKMDDLHSGLRQTDADIREMGTKIEEEQKKLRGMEEERESIVKARQKYIAEVEKKTAEAEEKRKKNSWIDEEKEHFGEKGTDFDFEGYSYEVGSKSIEDMSNEMKRLDNSVNLSADATLATWEHQVVEIQKKQIDLGKIRQQLMDTINQLDYAKLERIQVAFDCVSKDFGNIFCTLLPGSEAKLTPPLNKTIYEGLEIKVAFNGKWKESLTELSGGQRSLVALSFVLAMLKFKPAPIYLLDEVDAALDVSHTQNIGTMIKKHFTQSQFIVVSLKECFYKHANVLFTTSFKDGTSHVTRTVQNNPP